MTDETRRALRINETQLLKWRMGGRSQKAKTLLLVTGVAIMILMGIRMLSAAPLPQYEGRRMRRQFTPEQQLDRMTRQLHLTKDQRAQIKPILIHQHKQMMELRQDTSLSREERFARFRELRKHTFEEIHPILDAKQQKKLEKMQERRRERMEQRGGPRPY